MSSPQDQQKATAEAAARMKDEGRSSRFSFRNRAEHLLRRDMKEEAMQVHCKTQVADFAGCANEQGLLVVFACQPALKTLNQCLAIHNGEEAWERYKLAHKDELDRRSRGEKI